jgi:hypothetical protein
MSETPPHPTGGDKIDAQGSQGFVNRPSGDVHQHWGDVKHYHGPQTAHDRTNRQRMLAAVRDFWVKGVLEQSLYQEVLIALGLHTDPQAIHSQTIHYKGLRLSRDAAQEPYALPPGTTIAQAFDDAHQRLLILGAPGGGKTTLLLDLARTLINRAEQDETHPIPVVFNLSSWAQQRQPLEQWLVQELREQNGAGKHLAQAWVQQRAILPLLDGLDEVAAPHRAACVAAINTYCAEQSPEGLVVCSRLAEFRQVGTPLALDAAVVLQPLDDAQMAAFFERGGAALAGVRAALEADAELKAMARVPLMLHIVALAYVDEGGHATTDAIPQAGDTRTHLFDRYVQRMFQRRGRSHDQPYPPDKTVRWLSWLAGRLQQHNQTVFQLEQMQPTWLETRRQWWVYAIFNGLMGWLIGNLFIGILLIIPTGILFGGVGILAALVATCMLGGFVGIYFAMITSINKEIRAVERIQWSWSHAVSHFKILLLFCLIIGIVAGSAVQLFSPEGGVTLSIATGLAFALFFLGIIVLSQGAQHKEVSIKKHPYEGLVRSLSNAYRAGVVGMVISLPLAALLVIGGLRPNLFGETIFGGTIDLLYGAVFGGMLFGGVSGFTYGGYIIVQLPALLATLALYGYLPLRLVPFLDYAAERIFLRKVGGSYIFVHRMLLEYFAALSSDRQRVLVERMRGGGN